ncbi:bile acid:sodium symporter family protein [Bacterioplanoides sp.]|uniref:bile acid:sodium symporter family protein n=1 Tax=Bacterioplanoides sp. TaxID=2066072 RepID=UPI003AFFC56D
MYDLLIQIGLPIAVVLMMTGVGLSLTPADFRRVAQQPQSFILGAVTQLLALPLICVVVIAAFDLTGELAIGLFIIALSPGGPPSNLFAYLAKGDVGLSVSLTAVIGLITPLTIPLLASWALGYYANNQQILELPVLRTWLQLIMLTVMPVLVGMVLRARWPQLAIKTGPYISKLSVATLAAVTLSIVINIGTQVIDYAIVAGPAVLTLNLLTMLLGYSAGKWLLNNEAQARSIGLEAGLQNGTLAILITATLINTSVANATLISSAEMTIAPTIYSLFMFVSAGLFTGLMLKKDQTRFRQKAVQ